MVQRDNGTWCNASGVLCGAVCSTGLDDGATPPESFQNMARSFKAYFRLASVPHAGHFVHREQPEEFARVALEFLRTPLAELQPPAADADSGGDGTTGSPAARSVESGASAASGAAGVDASGEGAPDAAQVRVASVYGGSAVARLGLAVRLSVAPSRVLFVTRQRPALNRHRV